MDMLAYSLGLLLAGIKIYLRLVKSLLYAIIPLKRHNTCEELKSPKEWRVKTNIRGEKMFKGFQFFFQMSMRYDKKYFIFMVLNQAALAVGTVAAMILPRFLINAILSENRDIQWISFLVLLSAGVPFVAAALNGIFENHIFLHRINVYNKFNRYMSERILQTDYVYVEQENFIELRKKAEKYLYGDYRGFGVVFENMVTAFGQVVIFLAAVGIISTMHPLFLFLFAGMAAIEAFLQGKIKKKNHQVSVEQVPLEHRMSYLNDVVANFEYGKELRINGLNQWISGKLKNQISVLMGFYTQIARNNDKMSLMSSFMMFIQQIATYGYLIYQILLAKMGIGDFTMYLSALNTFTSTLQKLSASLVDVKQYGEYYKYLEEYLNLPVQQGSGGEVIQKKGPHEIIFDHVSFTYPGQTEEALKNISLTIHQGEKIAIVGENGAGKTTLTKLLTRLYDADKGKISIDGKDIKKVDRDCLAELFAVVYQDFKLFSFTLKENIALDKSEDISDQEITDLLEKTGLSSKVNSLKKGVHTYVYKNFDPEGFQPSGGEAQKIALCRAAFKDADIIILDEPTAALDPKAEDDIYRRFDEIAGGRTTFYITHRLASTRFCDRIVVLKKGEICEVGSHSQLIEKGGYYARLYGLQAKYYKESREKGEEKL